MDVEEGGGAPAVAVSGSGSRLTGVAHSCHSCRTCHNTNGAKVRQAAETGFAFARAELPIFE